MKRSCCFQKISSRSTPDQEAASTDRLFEINETVHEQDPLQYLHFAPSPPTVAAEEMEHASRPLLFLLLQSLPPNRPDDIEMQEFCAELGVKSPRLDIVQYGIIKRARFAFWLIAPRSSTRCSSVKQPEMQLRHCGCAEALFYLNRSQFVGILFVCRNPQNTDKRCDPESQPRVNSGLTARQECIT